MKRFTLYEDTGSVTSSETEWDYQGKRKDQVAISPPIFWVLMIGFTLLALFGAIWYVHTVNKEQADKYEFQDHSKLPSK